jgi:hypothetical protein
MKWKFIPAALPRAWKTKTFSLLILLAITGLLIGPTTLERHRDEAEAARADVLQHAETITHDCFLLRQLPPGQGENVRLALSKELNEEIKTLHRLSPANNAETREFIGTVCWWLMRDLRRNPDRYLCSSPGVRSQQLTAWNAVQTPELKTVIGSGQPSSHFGKNN